MSCCTVAYLETCTTTYHTLVQKDNGKFVGDGREASPVTQTPGVEVGRDGYTVRLHRVGSTVIEVQFSQY